MSPASPSQIAPVRIVQISDLHIKRDARLAYRRVDTAAALRRAVRQINALASVSGPIDAVFATGDLVDTGSVEEYAVFRALTGPLQAPLYLLPGNHDSREGMRAAFPEATYLPGDGPLDYRVRLGPLSVLALDSTVPGKAHGAFDGARIDWLSGELDALHGRPVLLFTHHPPFDTGIAHMDVQRLRNAAPLLECLAGRTNVLLLGCGHVHRAITTTLAGLPVAIAPSPAHAVALDHRDTGPSAFCMEPGAFLLHIWQPHAGGGPGWVQSQLCYVDAFDGPHPFHDDAGRLLD